ncbi:HEAT repeat domain-containing protein [Haliangium sp.]|uniref:HEAT repeat domain-containing protein n=1 Tax=Haliangium sp. TaxID=2663208 RepID=UPI003D09B3BE
MTKSIDIDALIAQCASEDPSSRVGAVCALERGGREHVRRAGPALMSLLTDTDWSVRNNAAGALGTLRYVDARQAALQQMLRVDPHATPRAAAAEALGELGDPAARDALIAALADDDFAVRMFAAISLGLLSDPSAIDALRQRLIVEPHPRTRIEILAAALRLGDDAAFDELMAIARGADEERRSDLCNALDDLLYRTTPAALIDRADELDQQLAAWDCPKLRERLAAVRGGAAQVAAQVAAQSAAQGEDAAPSPTDS